MFILRSKWKRLILLALYGPISSAGAFAQNVIMAGPAILQFRSPGYGTPVNVTSISAQAEALQLAVSGTNASDFSFISACPAPPQQLIGFSACQITVRFRPSAAGTRTAVLTVTPQTGAAANVILIGYAQPVVKSLGFSSPELTFPSVAIGAPASVGEVSLTGNGGPIDIQSISIVGADPSDFILTNSTCPSVLAAQVSCSLTVSFQPVAVGSRTAAVSVGSNAPPITIQLAGYGTPSLTQLTVPGVVDFLAGGIGATQHMPLTLLNSGSEPIAINGITLVGANASDFLVGTNPCQTLASQATCTADLTFTPSATGLRVANAIISDTAPGSPHVVSLNGIGQSQISALAWQGDPVASLAFSSVPLNSPATQGLYLRNLGNVPVSVLAGVQGPNASDFQLDASNCSAAPFPLGGFCKINVTFTPSAYGVRGAYIVVTDPANGQSIFASLIGSGAPGYPLFPQRWGPAGSQVLGTSSAASPFELVSTITKPVTITGFSLAGSAASDFQMQQNGCAAGTVIPSRGLGCTVNFIFTPSALGFRFAAIDVSFSSSAGDGTLQFFLAATGVPPSSGSIEVLPESDLPGPMFAIAQPLGKPVSQDAVVLNTGYVPVTLTGASVTGAAASDYQVTGEDCGTIAVQNLCEISVQFTPSAVGLRPAVLQVSDSASGSPQNLLLLGAGSNGSPVLTCDPCAISAGALALGSSHNYEIDLDALGTAPVNLSSLQIVGPAAGDFTLLSGCPVVTVSSACEIEFTFHPSVTGQRSAQIEVASDATGSPLIIPLNGVGSTPMSAASVTPTPISFPYYQGVGYSSSQIADVFSIGNSPLTFTGFAIAGADAGDFNIAGNSCTGPVLPRNYCELNISFTPTGSGLRTASLVIADNSSQPFQSIPLVGLGAPAVKQFAATPSSLSWAGVGVGRSESLTLTVGSVGTVPVTIQSVSVVGPDAADFPDGSSEPTVLNPGQSFPMGVTFAPTATGLRTAQLVITTDAPGSPFIVQLTGTGE